MAIDPRSILPTKINLINLRRNLNTIVKIRKILEDKRDVLLLNIRIVSNEYAKVQKTVIEKLEKAYEMYFLALSESGFSSLDIIEKSISKTVRINIGERAAFGIKVPVLAVDRESLQDPSYLSTTLPITIAIASRILKDVLEDLIKMVEAEATLNRLIDELRNTQKLINALDYVIVPNYRLAIKRIKLVLEERMREDFTRLKLMKRKLLARGAEVRR